MRVFQGFNNQAGQPGQIAEALRAHGVEAQSHCTTVNFYSYPADCYISPEIFQDPKKAREYFTEICNKFDIFHFHSSVFFHSEMGRFPFLQDLIMLKLLGKKVIFHFRGSEARQEGISRQLNPYHFYDEKHFQVDLIKYSRPDWIQKQNIASICAIADRVYATDPEIKTYVPEAKIVPRLVRVENESPTAHQNNKRPLVLHAPSKRGLKGTNEIVAVLKQLKSQGIDFDYKLVEGLPNDEAKKLYEQADIVIDQMRIGWYGVLAVEAMAMGKAVVCYIRKDLISTLPSPLPIMASDLEQLADSLSQLIIDKTSREKLGSNAYEYYRRVHSPEAVANLLIDDYKKLLTEKPQKSPSQQEAIIQYFSYQFAENCAEKRSFLVRVSRAIKKLVKLMKTVSVPTFLGLFISKLKVLGSTNS